MTTKMKSFLILFAFLTSALSFAGIPVKRTLAQNNLEQVDSSDSQITTEDGEMTHAPAQVDTTTLLLWFFLGGLGMHRFYMGDIGIGILQLLTFGGLGLWWLIDGIRLLTGSLS
jgi:hypothetical protein